MANLDTITDNALDNAQDNAADMSFAQELAQELQAEEAETAALMKLYPAHVPPIKPLQRVELRPGKSPLDRETGRPAMILSVDALDPEGDTVEAIGKWFAGDAVTGFYTFTLRKSGDEWHIESVK